MTSWLIPCSPDIYDAESAFQEYGSIIWHQQCRLEIGDTAYIYVSAPVKEIRCRCTVMAVDIPCDIGTDDGYVLDENFCARSYRRYMELRLDEMYNTPALGYHFLIMNGLSGPIRSQRRATAQLEAYIRKAAHCT